MLIQIHSITKRLNQWIERAAAGGLDSTLVELRACGRFLGSTYGCHWLRRHLIYKSGDC